MYSTADDTVQFAATALFNLSGRGVQPRASYSDPASYISADRLYEEMGITQEDLNAVGDIDIE